ncbi:MULTISPECIES: cell wall metabolism sensor histidine kinase WalK [unclassified Fusibacter]|uniref:sensor histidine kinase n=1 Tax=unclassified Fusibacter TaxID=2624464 RepID=UPI001013A293|nr:MULTISPECIES: HAMP domain-containing sensor histidine kinase [unclassified Fusibacter]MCK8058687.1 HAMP domain-containing histidine kinase [Fusibacter sp. A2]NPE21761.1 GHKL domain-containing protein [Fusibacter sp. A1]RXV61335.1 GHKL domain-containing protein [Fusibacter sp. A1]
MFRRLQLKMTVYYTLILIGILVATNLSVYLLMVNYNNYQIASEIKFMLESIESSEWLYETDTDADDLPEADEASIRPMFLSSGDETSNDKDDDEDDDDEKEDDDGKYDDDLDVPKQTDSEPEIETSTAIDETQTSGEDESGPESIEQLILPKTEDLLIPKILDSFSFYAIYDNQDHLVRRKSDNEDVFNQLVDKSMLIKEGDTPSVAEVRSERELYYLIAKMPIIIQNQRLGHYVVFKDVTLVFETLRNLVKILIYSFIAGVIVSVGIGYLIAGRSLKPIIRAYESKQVFLANASHELKTPLSIIMLSTETLEGEVDESKTFERGIITGIKEETMKMNELVRNLLFLARSDNHTIASAKEELDLSVLLSGESDKFKRFATAKAIAVEEIITPGIRYHGDKRLLAQAFGILIDNAIKYTKEHGQVVIKIENVQSVKHVSARVTISDSGIGIPTDELANIFDRFYRLDSSRSKETGGHGLGLSIAKEIIEDHGGSIRVNSIENIGTTFMVDL